MEDIAYHIFLEQREMNHNNFKQIYHTSHCGSTLMASLLMRSCLVYSEPKWIEELIKDAEKNNSLDKNTVIKFPSSFCCHARKFQGKKVFLFRKLMAETFFRLIISNG